MRKFLFWLCGFAVLTFFLGCIHRNKEEYQSAKLIVLKVDGKSILEKMDDSLSFTFTEVTEADSVELITRCDIPGTVVNVNSTGSVRRNGSKSTVYLLKGTNTVTITLTPPNSPDKKVYTINIPKRDTLNVNESSNLKTLKVDDENVLLKMVNNSAKLQDREFSKDTAVIIVSACNNNAQIRVSNNGSNISEDGNNHNKYEVSLRGGDNEIQIAVKSEKYNEKLYTVKIYRFQQDIRLKSFRANGEELFDEASDFFKKSKASFENNVENVTVYAEAVSSNINIIVKKNDAAVNASGNKYVIPIDVGNNNIEVSVTGTKETSTKKYNIDFYRRKSVNNDAVCLSTLEVDDNDIIDYLTSDNDFTMEPVEHTKSSLKVKAVCSIPDVSVKVTSSGTQITGASNIYNVNLQDGLNTVTIELIKNNVKQNTYLIHIERYPAAEVLHLPAADEVKVDFFVSDRINGSGVDGTYLNVHRTAGDFFEKKVLVRNGKASINLKKNNFYNFKLEGRKAPYSAPYYAASEVISYFIDEARTLVPIVQCPLKQLNRTAEAPRVTSFKFGGKKIDSGTITECTHLSSVEVEIESPSGAVVGDPGFGEPRPMLGVGAVPNSDSQNTFKTYSSGNNTKNSQGNWVSKWGWSLSGTVVKKGSFDIIAVVYDVAHNRVEYHSRFSCSSAEVEEDASLKVENLSLELERRPTHSGIFSVGHDNITGSSTHYIPSLLFKVTKSGYHKPCIGFDVYRKCTSDSEQNFRLVKQERFSSVKVSNPSTAHKVKDYDGALEDGKTYEYKIVAYTEENKKSVLSGASSIRLTMPKAAALILEYPAYGKTLTYTEGSNLGFVFKFSEPSVLENAEYMELGLIITERSGHAKYASKFKYVFNDNNSGKPEIYFAAASDIKSDSYGGYSYTNYSKKSSHYTSGTAVSDLVQIDKNLGKVVLTKKFMQLYVNLVHSGSSYFSQGETYYWDIVDWGTVNGLLASEDDRPCKIVRHDNSSGGNVTIIHYVNDWYNGSNAWNGKAEFSIK